MRKLLSYQEFSSAKGGRRLSCIVVRRIIMSGGDGCLASYIELIKPLIVMESTIA